MTFPSIAGTGFSNRGTNATSTSIALPGGSVNGQLAIVHVSIDGSGTVSTTTPGWTVLVNQTDASDRDLVLYGVIGTATWPIVLTHATEQAAWRTELISNWSGTPEAVFSFKTASGTTIPVPPITPSWGVQDTLYLALLTVNTTSQTGPSGVPTGYSGLLAVESSAGSSAATRNVRAWRQAAVATESPAAWTGLSTTAPTATSVLVAIRGPVTAVQHQVSGSVPVVVGASGTIGKGQPVSGTAAVVVSVSGNATVVPGAVTHQVSGTVAVNTAVSGAATRVPVVHQVSGTVAVTTGASGVVSANFQAMQWVEVRRNLALNPVATNFLGGFSPNNVYWDRTFVTSVPAPHPQGITTAAMVQNNGGGALSAVASLYNVDLLANTGPARYWGAWYYVNAPGYQVSNMLGSVVDLPANQWTWITLPQLAAGQWSGVEVFKPDLSPAAGHTVWITGVTAFPDTIPTESLWGDQVVSGARISWAGTANASESIRQEPVVKTAVATGASGAVTVAAGAVTHQVSGTVPIVTTAAGTIAKRSQVAGTASVITGATGSVSSRRPISGTVPVLTTASGAVTRVPVVHQVSGSVAVTTAANGAASLGSVGGTVQHDVFDNTPAETYTGYNDGQNGLWTANQFYTYGDPAYVDWTLVGVRIYIPAGAPAGIRTTPGKIAWARDDLDYWSTDTAAKDAIDRLSEAGNQQAFSTLVTGWNDILFATPLPWLHRRGVFVGISWNTGGYYVHAFPPGPEAFPARDGTRLARAEHTSPPPDGLVRGVHNAGIAGAWSNAAYGLDIIIAEPVAGGIPVAGVTPVTTGVSGAVTLIPGSVTHQVAGTVAVATTTSGAPTRVPVQQQVAGAVPVTTAVTGAIASRRPVAGVVPVVTATSGSAMRVPIAHQVSGTVAVTTDSSGVVSANFVITPYAERRNEVLNPALASTANGFAAGNFGNAPGAGTGTRVAGATPDGLGFGYVKAWTVAPVAGGQPTVDYGGVSGNPAAGFNTPLPPNTPYTHSVWFYGPAGTYAIVNVERTADGVANTAILQGPNVVLAAPGWVRLSLSAVSTPTTAWHRGSLRHMGGALPGVGTEWRITRAMLELSPTLNPYFDGDSTDNPNERYDWAGAPSNSASVMYSGAEQIRVITDSSGGIGSATRAVSGTVDVVTVASGAISKQSSAAGVVPVTTGVSGTASRRLPVSGTVAVTVDVIGTPSSKQNVSGVVPVITTVVGNALPPGGSSGVVPVKVGVSGAVTSKQGVSGDAVEVTTGVTGAVTSRQRIAGTAAVTVGVSGAVQINPRGRVDVLTGVSGAVTQVHQVSGRVDVTTGANGDIAGGQSLSGTATVTTSVSGAATLVKQVSGVVSVVTVVSGTLAGRVYSVSGTVEVLTTVSGGPTAILSVSGTVPVLTTVFGRVAPGAQPPVPPGDITLIPFGPGLWLQGAGPRLRLTMEPNRLPLHGGTEDYPLTNEPERLTLKGTR